MTVRWLPECEADVVRRLSSARGVFCFLDYDGTLAPLAPTPSSAVPLPGTAVRLQALASLPGTRVALITGRTIADLRGFLDLAGIYYVGVHGLEIRFPDGAIEMSDSVPFVRSVLPEVKRQIEQAIDGLPGILIEDKGLAVACHYRRASRADAAKVREAVVTIVRQFQRRVATTFGHEVVELRSTLVDKGKAVCRLLTQCGDGPLALYIGDDQTDEDAFRLLPPESITIRVGTEMVPTAAHYRVDEPSDVLRFLDAVVEARCSRREPLARARER
ncbi:MAG: trehalose-phosphatase [Deltaproteobacteria bacterium]|nr:trehalose-phosphatase [Deltaproteobacteria bacterium]